MKRWLLNVSVLLIITAIPTFGDTAGNDVLNSCQAALRFYDNNGAPAGEHFDPGWCIGWVAGTLQLRALSTDGLSGCTPGAHPSQVISWRPKAYRMPRCCARLVPQVVQGLC
jgi:hypothetical protein